MKQIYLTTAVAILITTIGACSSRHNQSTTAADQQEVLYDTYRIEQTNTRPETRKKDESRTLGTEAESNIAFSSVTTRPATLMEKATSADMSMQQPMQQSMYFPIEPTDRENYQHLEDNPIKQVQHHPVSTFSIDVDTGAYANVRRFLNQGQLPNKDAVRVEEMINYFSYHYPNADKTDQPFSTVTEIAPSPWNENAHLLHIGIKGYEVKAAQRPSANLVFLIDVSGSMHSDNKIGLLKRSLTLLSNQLRHDDRIAIAVYAGAAGVVLPSTPGDQRFDITQALNQLHAGGSTNGAAGIRLAYDLAKEGYIENGINRVILATDGDFNVGTTNFDSLVDLVERNRETGVSLTTLGFGTGNYNDHLMEQLADSGNGNYSYIDNLNEANKVLVEEMTSTLQTIAKDVKIQIEFNPAAISQYRLIGYENRVLANEDFENDKVDAGEIGAGHSVTAIYEVILTGNTGWIKPLRYQDNEIEQARTNELAHLRIRYKEPTGHTSQLQEWPIYRNQIASGISETSDNFRFAASVAGFGQLLRGGNRLDNFSYQDVLDLARKSRGSDDFGYRGEFLRLISLAETLSGSRS